MKKALVPGLIVLGMLLIIASLVAPEQAFNFLSNNKIATVIEANGSVTVQGLDELDPLRIKENDFIKNLDLIKTTVSSEAIISITQVSGEVRILENSEVLFEKTENNKIILTVRSGDLLVDQFGKKPSFFVRKNGQEQSAMDYAITHEKNADVLRKNGITLTQSENESLSQARIEEILNSKRNDFFRCYGQLIQKEEASHGDVVLGFEISTSGKVQKIDVTQSDIQNDSFKSCLMEVVARTTFPRFKGKNIMTVFPLKFE